MSTTDYALWNQVTQFHGHECPGIAIGFRMALQAKTVLSIEKSSQDEEIVCITENDACGVDAVQFILSCTFGKGNLVYYPTGKMAMSFYARDTGKSCRFILKSLKHLNMNREEKQAYLLTGDFNALFETKPTQMALPQHASHYESAICTVCHEETAGLMLHMKNGQIVCRQCDPLSLQTLLP